MTHCLRKVQGTPKVWNEVDFIEKIVKVCESSAKIFKTIGKNWEEGFSGKSLAVPVTIWEIWTTGVYQV